MGCAPAVRARRSSANAPISVVPASSERRCVLRGRRPGGDGAAAPRRHRARAQGRLRRPLAVPPHRLRRRVRDIGAVRPRRRQPRRRRSLPVLLPERVVLCQQRRHVAHTQAATGRLPSAAKRTALQVVEKSRRAPPTAAGGGVRRARAVGSRTARAVQDELIHERGRRARCRRRRCARGRATSPPPPAPRPAAAAAWRPPQAAAARRARDAALGAALRRAREQLRLQRAGLRVRVRCAAAAARRRLGGLEGVDDAALRPDPHGTLARRARLEGVVIGRGGGGGGGSLLPLALRLAAAARSAAARSAARTRASDAPHAPTQPAFDRRLRPRPDAGGRRRSSSALSAGDGGRGRRGFAGPRGGRWMAKRASSSNSASVNFAARSSSASACATAAAAHAQTVSVGGVDSTAAASDGPAALLFAPSPLLAARFTAKRASSS